MRTPSAPVARPARQQGLALPITMMMMVVFTTMLLGFWFVVSSEQKTVAAEREHGKTFYAAQAGLEKMSTDLAALFTTHAAPAPADIAAIGAPANAPAIDGISYSRYQISYQTNSDGTLHSVQQVIGGSGPLNGLQGIITPFTLQVIADSPDGAQSDVSRQIQEVAIPVFEFGIFSENDLSFFAGPNFNFGGRVHTNGNLYLAEGNGSTLKMSDVVTAAGNVIRTQLSNGWPTSSNYNGTVDVLTGPGSYRALAMSEGSLTGGPGTAVNPAWPNLSLTTYNGNIRSGSTGAQPLNLALALAGATPIDMIHRPPASELPTSAIGEQRFYNEASLRILLDDNAENLPVPADAIPLDSRLYSDLPVTINTSDGCHPPVAAVDSTHSRLGGYIEIQMQTSAGVWQDVTAEILSQGFEYARSCTSTAGVTYDPILHLERLSPTLSSVTGPSALDYIPINMYDAREGELRDNRNTSGTVALNGVMNVVELDVGNLQKWFAGQIGSSGPQALNQSGFIVYFSDRRGNQDKSGNETGEYGNEDNINPSDPAGMPNGVLDEGEDVNGNGTLDFYGETAHPASNTSDGYTNPPAPSPALQTPPKPFDRVQYTQAEQAPVIFFRRALRLVDGPLGSLPPQVTANCSSPTGGGFTVAAENPVYVQGNYNAANSGFTDGAGACHVPAAVIADAVTLLSNNWLTDTDTNSGSKWTVHASTDGDLRSMQYADAEKDPVIFFRRTLRLVDGPLGSLPPQVTANCSSSTGGGFTVAAENPVYVQGNYNAANSTFTDGAGACHVPAAVIADAVTLLSNNWRTDTDGLSPSSGTNCSLNATQSLTPGSACNGDNRSFQYADVPGSRPATTTYYRMGVIAGKNLSFPRPAWGAGQDFGTDGGAHNFLRYLESWSGQGLYYRGALISLFTSRQATGVYKCCNVVYGPPTRAYNFDTDFEDISKLPPGTPRFTDVNALSFQQQFLADQ